MITFACKTIKQEDLIRCSFNLNKTEYKIFMFLLQSKKSNSIKQISKNLKFDRTTVQKSIKNLKEKELLIKEKRKLKTGGFEYLYKIKNKKEIKNRMIKLIEIWTKKAKIKIKSL